MQASIKMRYKFDCRKCGEELDLTKEICTYCRVHNDPPNIRFANHPDEKSALETNYKNSLRKPGTSKRIATKVKRIFDTKGRVAISRPPEEILNFISKDNAIYENYIMQILGGGKMAMDDEINNIRAQFENSIFPQFFQLIRFGSLYFTNEGLNYFGTLTMILKKEACINCTSFFYGNPYILSSKLGLSNKEIFPPGYRATWKDSHKLIVFKHSAELNEKINKDELQVIINKDTKDGPDYIEAHFFDGFPAKIIEQLVYSGSKAKGDINFMTWNVIKAKVSKSRLDIKCVEV